MSIIRIHKKPGNFTVIPNSLINDPNLNPDALGLLVYLMSKPDNWEVLAPDIQRRFGTGKHKPYSMLKNLREAGYATYKRDSSGKTSWDIYESPQTNPHPENRDEGQKPHPEKPDQDNRDVLINTERAVNTEKHSSSNLRFDEWWSEYPKKVGRKPCSAIWKRRKMDGMADTLIADVRRRKRECRKWIDGYAPNPQTYLNQDRWEDEIETVAARPQSVPKDPNACVQFAAKRGIHPKRGESMPDFRARIESELRVH